jgi:hemoglobin
LSDAKRHLALFLIQRTGGATTYSNERGHPRMRARHLPFRIGMAERDAWMHNMTEALNAVPEFEPHKEAMMTFFSDFATFMINQ